MLAASAAEAATALGRWLEGDAGGDGRVQTAAALTRRPFRDLLRGAAATAEEPQCCRRWLAGESVRWPAPRPGVPVAALPLYPFEPDSHWGGASEAPSMLTTIEDGASWKLTLTAAPGLVDHVVDGRALLPAAATPALVAAAAARRGLAAAHLADVVSTRPLPLDAPATLRFGVADDVAGTPFESWTRLAPSPPAAW